MNLTEAEEIHKALLQRWRTAMNLVGPGPIDGHFLDAIGAVDGLDAHGRWADLGSGAGFPGIALAARHPEISVTLVESRAKRATFLTTVVRDAKLSNATVFHGRAEELQGGFDGVISRAFRPPLEYLQDAERLLVSGGQAVLMSGDVPPPFEGWVVRESRTYPVPGGTRARTVLVR
jgi:16S rRNA (guanine527-N7)-methyltransferase